MKTIITSFFLLLILSFQVQAQTFKAGAAVRDPGRGGGAIPADAVRSSSLLIHLLMSVAVRVALPSNSRESETSRNASSRLSGSTRSVYR